MLNLKVWFLGVIFGGCLMTVSTFAAVEDISAFQGGKDLVLDGLLSEAVWQQAGKIDNLIQQSPHSGQPTPFQTEVFFLVDKSGLTIGLMCHDPNPESIAIHTMERDGEFDGDDTVSLVLDPFGDQRRGYFFEINAAGARADGLVTGSESISMDWDGIWNAATKRTPDGWSAEIRIPAQSLRFPPGKNRWGLNVQRIVARQRLVLRWSDYSLNAQLEDLRRAGGLSGLEILQQGLGVSISPYGLLHVDRERDGTGHDATADLGGDITYNLTSEISAVATFNTDFAETEVDTRQVNLTRFRLFFPEKRAFFLEGSDMFSFGSGTGYDFIPFFSRRIGLFEGEQVSLDLGGKIIGRSGKLGVGLLGARTGASNTSSEANLFVGRVTYDVNPHLTVGTILTTGDPDGISDNTLGGVDALWQTSTLAGDKNFSVGAWFAGSTGNDQTGRENGWGLKVDYPNDLWDIALIYRDFGDGLHPALGFLPRPGTRWYLGGVSYMPRPEEGLFDWVRQFYFECYPKLVQDLNGNTESWRIFTAPFNARTESGEHIELNYVPQYEWLNEPFEISDGVVIPIGEYKFDRFRVELESAEHRQFMAASTVWFGDFFTGTLTQWELELRYASSGGHLQLGIGTENDFAKLPEGDFIQRLYQVRALYAFNPSLIFATDTQYDSESREIGFNAKLRWTFEPGNDLYLVWTSSFLRPLESREWSLVRNVEDHGAVKLRWTFRY